MKFLRAILASFALITAIACGGGDADPMSPGGSAQSGDGNIAATINGTAFRSDKKLDQALHASDIYTVGGLNSKYVVGISLIISAPGTYSLAPGATGAAAVVGDFQGEWSTDMPGASGTVTVTVLTANRIAGTFSFDAFPESGTAKGTLQVRNGTFDMTF